MQKRDFLLMLKRLQLIDPVHLTAAKIITLLADEDPNVRPTNTDIRLDIEVGLFSFFVRIQRSLLFFCQYADVFFGIFRSINCLCIDLSW